MSDQTLVVSERSDQEFDWSHPTTTERQTHVHPATKAMLKNFKYEHLPPHLKEVSKPICEMAKGFAETLSGPELTAGLRKLLEAKDCMVRARLEQPAEQELAKHEAVDEDPPDVLG